MVDQVKKIVSIFDMDLILFCFVGLIPPIEPFRITNRFTTATVFGILVFEILKIFEEFLFSTDDLLNRGIFIESLEKIVAVLLIG